MKARYIAKIKGLSMNKQNPNFTTFSDVEDAQERFESPGKIQFIDPRTGEAGTLDELKIKQQQRNKLALHTIETGYTRKQKTRELSEPEGLSFSA
ncbi:MAG: hypothetical protein ABJA64_01180 [Candidatus Saccharibacteria bacterium]